MTDPTPNPARDSSRAQRKPRNFVLWLVIGLPALVVVASLATQLRTTATHIGTEREELLKQLR